MVPNAAFSGTYDYRLVTVSIFISLLTAFAALDLAGRAASTTGRVRMSWLVGGSISMGIGIWAMHYVGMEAYKLPVPVLYDWPTVLVSLIAAVLASGTALFLVTRPTLGIIECIMGSIAMGLGISAMHYIGMDAMRLPAMCRYSPGIVVLSVVLGIGISYVALRLTFALSARNVGWGWRKTGGALTMGLAIPVMHYVGMTAVSFEPMGSVQGNLRNAASVSPMALLVIAIASMLLLFHVLIVSLIDRRFASQTQRLRDNELQMQSVFDNMKEGIIVLDLNYRVVQLNQAAAEIFGLPLDMRVQKDFRSVFELFLAGGKRLPPEKWPGYLALHGEFVQDMEMVVKLRATGKRSTVEISTAPIRNHAGVMNQVILSYRDVTERKRFNEARARLAAIVESSEDAIIGKDNNGIVVSWNRGAETVFGYTAEEMIGAPILRLLPSDRLHEEDQILARIRKGKTVEHFETERLRKDGIRIHVSLTISPIRDENEEIVGASKIARDITGRVLLERQLRQSQKLEAVGQLTAGIAHDFNNLLAVILGSLDLLARSVSDEPAKLKRVETAIKAATRGADLTRRLLMFSSRDELRPSSTVLEEMIENMIEVASRTLGSDIQVVQHYDKTLKPIFVDASGLEAALLNLVVNARDAMPEGGVLTIATSLHEIDEGYPAVQLGELDAGQYVCISVADTGTGMSRGEMDRAFEPFYTTKARGKGTGLGLAMVYGFAKQSGGIARIYSEPGRGTKVSIYLPFAEGLARSSQPSGLVRSQEKQPHTVLVVDDEAELLEIALCYLSDLGYQGLQAKDAFTALMLLSRETEVHALITDISMPGGMNGVKLAQEAKLINPEIKVVYCSGFPAEALSEKADTTIDGPLLRKPYLRSEFEAVIRQVLEGNGSASM